jgi:hypothetical protein
MRMANEIDADPDIGKHGGDGSKVRGPDLEDVGVPKQRLSEWREIRSAFVEWRMDEDHSERPDDRPSQPSRKKRPAVRYVLAEPTLFVTDAELIRRLVPEKFAYAAIHLLDHSRDSGFPQKQATWGKRRYWPAVKQWFDWRNGVGPVRTRE